MTLMIVIALIALLIIWFVGVQRKLVKQDEICMNAMSQIGVQTESRWDALTTLAELTKSYNEHEYKTIMEVIGKRAALGASSTSADANAQEEALGTAYKKIIAVAEQYPELKANEGYLKTMDSVNTYENQVRMSRMVYNDTITRFNSLCRQFPTSVVAGALGFKVREYLKETASKKDMPSMKI